MRAFGVERDPFAVLGISRGASKGDIKKAYRRLARKYHPDVNRGDPAAEERFKEIQWAYEVLTGKARPAGPAPGTFERKRPYPPSFFKNMDPFFGFFWEMRQRYERSQEQQQDPPEDAAT